MTTNNGATDHGVGQETELETIFRSKWLTDKASTPTGDGCEIAVLSETAPGARGRQRNADGSGAGRPCVSHNDRSPPSCASLVRSLA